jgi:hypothetical protein
MPLAYWRENSSLLSLHVLNEQGAYRTSLGTDCTVTSTNSLRALLPKY